MDSLFSRIRKTGVVAALLLAALACLPCAPARAGTYASAVTPFSWIDSASHTQVGAATAPYKFNSGFGCGTTLPTIDDNISDIIPMGFNFLFGDKVFNAVRIMTNGRLHLVNTSLPWDNTTCGYGSPVTQLPIPNAGLNYVMRLYGNDLDPTPKRTGYTTVCADSVTAANNPCYVSFATVGTAPARRFVVTWKGVPEWVSTGAKGAYDIQIIVQEDGDFVYQYGAHTAGPAATTAQIGWQISTSNYDTPTVGYPAQNFAIRFFVPHPLTEYLMEQSTWSGANSVLDTSGNNMHGSPVGTVSVVGGGRVCRGADIPNNTVKTTIDAIDTGLAVPTQIGSAGTIAFWYKSKIAWSGTGAQNAQLLDATVVDNNWFFLTKRSTGKLRFVIRDSTGVNRAVETTAITTAANTWSHVAVTWDFNPMITANNNKLTIYVDGVQRGQTTFTSSTTVISSSIGTLFLGDNRGSFIETTGTGNSANAVIDEFRSYNYALSQQGVASLMNLNSGCLDHYAIASSGSGTSCQPVPITLSAHTATHAAYINNNLVNLSTSDGKGDWSLITGHGTLTPGPADSGTATYRFSAESQAVLGLLHAVGTVTAHATDGISSDTENGPITLTATGCAPDSFNACELGSTRCTPAAMPSAYANLYTKLADTAFVVDLVALKADGTLDSSFTKPVSVNLLANTSTPTLGAKNCPTASAATIALGTVNMTGGRAPSAGVGVAANAFSSASPNYSAYRDVRVQVVCNATDCQPSGLTACSSDAFAVRPINFTVTSTANAHNAGTSTSATPVTKAGTAFSLTATAVPGYNGTPLIDSSKLEWPGVPANGRAAPGVGSLSGTFGAATVASGVAVGSSFIYNEAGYFRFAVNGVHDDTFASTAGDIANGDCTDDFSNTPTNGKYGCKTGSAISNHFGRFIPDHFLLSAPSITPGGGTFSYMDQPFGIGLTLTATDASGGATANYANGFAKLDPTDVALWPATTLGTTGYALGAKNDTTDLSARLTASSVAAPATCNATANNCWFAGVAKIAANLKFGRPTGVSADATWGAYDALDIGVAPRDSDGVTLLTSALDLDANSDSTAERRKLGQTRERFGRLRLLSYYGSEQLPSRVEYRAEYWDGSRWATNKLDQTTPIGSGANLAVGGLTFNALEPFANGVGFILFDAAATGSYDIAVNLNATGSDTSCNAAHGGTAANKPWLQGYWAAKANCGNTDPWRQDPNARIRLGSPKAPYLYLREHY